MDITFCDICNESVPQADVELGWAVRRNGRLICMRCDAAMSSDGAAAAPKSAAGSAAATATISHAHPTHAPSVPARGAGDKDPAGAGHGVEVSPVAAGEEGGPGGSEGTGGTVGWVSLVFGSAAIAFLVDWGRAYQVEIDGRFHSATAQLLAAEDRGDQRSVQLVSDLAATEERLTLAIAAELKPLQERLDELATSLDRQERRWQSFQQDLELIRADADARHSTAQLNFDRQAAHLKRIDEDLRLNRDKAIKLEEDFRGLAQGSVPIGLLPGGGLSAPTDGSPRWSSLLADLEHEDTSIRLEAVYALGDTKDLGVVPHLVPRLRDNDLFVRLAAARILEKLNAKTAVPELIEALADSETVVREAAVTALRTITSKNFRFEPDAPVGDREDAIDDWRKWWKKSSKAFLEG